MRVREQLISSNISDLKNSTKQQSIFMKTYQNNIKLVLKKNDIHFFEEIIKLFANILKQKPNYIFDTILYIGEKPDFKKYIDVLYKNNLDPNPEVLKENANFYGHDLLSLLLIKKYDKIAEYLITEKEYPPKLTNHMNYIDILSYDKNIKRLKELKDLGIEIFHSRDLTENINKKNINNLFKITDIIKMDKMNEDFFKNKLITNFLSSNIDFESFKKLDGKYNLEITNYHNYLLERIPLENLKDEKKLDFFISIKLDIKECFSNRNKFKGFLLYLIENENSERIQFLKDNDIIPDVSKYTEIVNFIDDKCKDINELGLKNILKLVDIKLPFIEENEEHNKLILKTYKELSSQENRIRALSEKDFLKENILKNSKTDNAIKKKRI